MYFKIVVLVTLVAWLGTVKAKECDKIEDCEMTDSICVKNVCQCPPNTIANSLHTKCLPVSNGFGSICEDNVQCSEGLKSGGICSKGTCSCSKGYHYFLGQCWKSAGLEEQCKQDNNCFVVNDIEAAVCSDEKVCVCSLGYYKREYTSCRRASYKPGDPCGIPLDCKFENPICRSNRTCGTGKEGTNYNFVVVKNEIEFDDNHIINALSSNIGNSCKKTEDCPKNAECDEAKKCRCRKGYYTVDNSTCYAELGANCLSDSDCLGKNTQCRNGTVCVCKQGYVTSYNGRYCDKMARNIAWSCLRDEQCGLFGPRSLCVKKKCACNEESHYIEKEMYCWIQKLIGEKCSQSQDCGNAEGVSCQNKKCQCSENFHPSSDKKDCRENRYKVGDVCVEDLDCQFQNSFCDKTNNGTCNCLDGYIVSDGKCLPGIGGNCTGNDDCKVEGSTCVNNTCLCNQHFISNSDFSKCLPVANNINQTCFEDPQCSKVQGVCVNKLCTCLNGSHFIDNLCTISRKLNESCTLEGNCTYIPNAFCYNKICMCLPGYREELSENRCSGSSSTYENISVFGILSFCLLLKIINSFTNTVLTLG